MSMIMNHDITSLLGQRIMQRNSLAMKRSLEKLSSGLRTKIADLDNTAELAIGETMRSRIFGMEKALNNSQDGISMIQTAVGGLTRTQSMLNRMRELSVQAANDALTQQDRSYIQIEINEIRDQIDLIGNSTQFNRKSLLNGDNAILWSSSD
ncbi:MAG: flagellin, partial [Synergistales bacterium]|nr:flagellin [Synergistales bacterium]